MTFGRAIPAPLLLTSMILSRSMAPCWKRTCQPWRYSIYALQAWSCAYMLRNAWTAKTTVIQKQPPEPPPADGGLPPAVPHPSRSAARERFQGCRPRPVILEPPNRPEKTGSSLNNGSRKKTLSHETISFGNLPGSHSEGAFSSLCSFPLPWRYGIRLRPKAFFGASGRRFMGSELSAG